MKEKSLTLISIAAALVTAMLMIYVVYQGNRAKASVSDFGIGVFNFTNQSGKNITHFTDSLEDYRKTVSSAEGDKAKEDIFFATIYGTPRHWFSISIRMKLMSLKFKNLLARRGSLFVPSSRICPQM